MNRSLFSLFLLFIFLSPEAKPCDTLFSPRFQTPFTLRVYPDFHDDTHSGPTHVIAIDSRATLLKHLPAIPQNLTELRIRTHLLRRLLDEHVRRATPEGTDPEMANRLCRIIENMGDAGDGIFAAGRLLRYYNLGLKDIHYRLELKAILRHLASAKGLPVVFIRHLLYEAYFEAEMLLERPSESELISFWLKELEYIDFERAPTSKVMIPADITYSTSRSKEIIMERLTTARLERPSILVIKAMLEDHKPQGDEKPTEFYLHLEEILAAQDSQ